MWQIVFIVGWKSPMLSTSGMAACASHAGTKTTKDGKEVLANDNIHTFRSRRLGFVWFVDEVQINHYRHGHGER